MSNVGLTLLRLVMKKYNIRLVSSSTDTYVMVIQNSSCMKASAEINYINVIEGEEQ